MMLPTSRALDGGSGGGGGDDRGGRMTLLGCRRTPSAPQNASSCSQPREAQRLRIPKRGFGLGPLAGALSA